LPPAGLKVEACSLLSKEEVGAIQNATMNYPAPADGGQGEFFMSQSYYGSEKPNMSVSIAAVEQAPEFPGNRTVTEFWHERLKTQIAKTEKADREGPEKEQANERVEKGHSKGSGEKEEREPLKGGVWR